MDLTLATCFLLAFTGFCMGQNGCPKGFVGHGFSCYNVLNEVGSWLSAMDYCKAFGMSLVVINDPGEHKFIKDFLYTNRHNYTRAGDFWTAGSHMMSTEWAWAGTGEEIEAFFWGPGEPNGLGNGENCLSYFSNSNFSWNDEGCSRDGYPLCEKVLSMGTNPGMGFQQ